MGLFIVTAYIGEVAYHIDLKGWFTYIHPVFDLSLPRRFVASSDGIKALEPIEVKDTQKYLVEHLLVHRHGH